MEPNRVGRRRHTHARTLRLVAARSDTFADPADLARAIRRATTIAEAHVLGAYFALTAAGESVTRDTLAWAISVELGRAVWPSYVQRGLRDARANRTLRRVERGRYEPGARLADLVEGGASGDRPARRIRRG